MIADTSETTADVLSSGLLWIALRISLKPADDWAALIASGIILFNAIHLLLPALNEVMDAAPSKDIVRKVRQLASTIPDVDVVEKCYVRKMGFDYYVDLHIQVNPNLTDKPPI